MNLKNKIICVTTFRQGDVRNNIERIRSEVFLDTVKNISKNGLHLLVIYTDTKDSYLKYLRKPNIITIKQSLTGMGNVRRESFNKASLKFPNTNYTCWIEPEKPDIVKFILPITNIMIRDNSNLGLFNRVNMSSYPPEQSYYYQFCRSVATQLTGFDIDYAFGPMVIKNSSIPYFSKYKGEYGDK